MFLCGLFVFLCDLRFIFFMFVCGLYGWVVFLCSIFVFCVCVVCLCSMFV